MDRVPPLLESLRHMETVAGFERTVGDEIQGLVESAEQACAVIRRVLRIGGWHVGVGCGSVDADVLAEIRTGTIRTARGSAFIRAREAVEKAKRYPVSVAVVGPDREGSEAAQALLQLIGVVVTGRTVAQREAGGASGSQEEWAGDRRNSASASPPSRAGGVCPTSPRKRRRGRWQPNSCRTSMGHWRNRQPRGNGRDIEMNGMALLVVLEPWRSPSSRDGRRGALPGWRAWRRSWSSGQPPAGTRQRYFNTSRCT